MVVDTDELLASLQEDLFGEGTVGKVWGVALPALSEETPPIRFPEWSFGRYETVNVDYWTAGFFPGSVYALLERAVNHPGFFPGDKIDVDKLKTAARWWAENLKTQIFRTDNHDLGFMIEPAFKREYELFGTQESKDALVTASNALSQRYDDSLGLIRSWDTAVNKRYQFDDPKRDFIVIIDNMCNLDLLYEGAKLSGNKALAEMATSHAKKTLKNHIRHPEWSTYHLLNYSKATGVPTGFTNQGFADDSTWARGQSWGVMGYAEAYKWTKIPEFLDASKNLAKYYLSRLPENGVPPWDFDAPDQDIKDISSGMVVVLGLLLVYEQTNEKATLAQALKLLKDCVDFAKSDPATIHSDGTVDLGDYDTILKYSTTQNNADSVLHWKNHGLVYADYYFLAIGNKLLDLGLYPL